MRTTRTAKIDWAEVYAQARRTPRSTVRVERSNASHPRNAGARPTVTWPVGQAADYAIEVLDGAPLSVREFNDHYEAFIDTIELSNRVVDALDANPKAAMLLGGALVGSAIGSSLSSRRDGAMLGAGIGLLVAAMMNEGTTGSRRR